MSKKKSREISESSVIDQLLGQEQAEKSRAAASSSAPKPKKRYTIMIDEDLLERVRDFVYHTPGENISALTCRLLRSHIDKAEKRRGTIPTRGGKKVATGRPVGR